MKDMSIDEEESRDVPDRARGRGRDEPLEKTGYRLPRSVVSMVREAVEAGEARSQNEFVERALRRELQAIRRRLLYEEYETAARDPEFRADLAETTDSWEAADGDGLPEDEG